MFDRSALNEARKFGPPDEGPNVLQIDKLARLGRSKPGIERTRYRSDHRTREDRFNSHYFVPESRGHDVALTDADGLQTTGEADRPATKFRVGAANSVQAIVDREPRRIDLRGAVQHELRAASGMAES